LEPVNLDKHKFTEVLQFKAWELILMFQG